MNEKLNIVNKKLSDFSIYNNGTWQSEKEITTSYCPDLGMGFTYQGSADSDGSGRVKVRLSWRSLLQTVVYSGQP